ncbi:class I SAM-dependent methyltransferase [Paenibacillus caui]|uniref:class I SAM-dependent methyltransferase n=1 Tax=Paenibacillus caui TaxID=2873927 RepID=UPI001CA7F123|nr:class I SAM-dependent methyltransferase [Paenibacillus caui]
MNKIIEYYGGFDEWGRLDREPVEFLVNWHYIRKYLPERGHVLDNGAGPGKYAIELAKQGFDVTLTDLTPRLVRLAKEKAEECGVSERFKGFHCVNAVQLDSLTDQQFDASLMLGPLYHLQTEPERVSALRELYRVTKKNGYVFVAFMTKIRHLTTSLTYPEFWKPNETLGGIQAFMQTGTFNHADEGRFTGVYYFDIEEIKPFMESGGFETVELIGSSSIAGSFRQEQFDYWRSRGEEEFEGVMNIIYREAGNPYNLAASSHLLYIGKRI